MPSEDIEPTETQESTESSADQAPEKSNFITVSLMVISVSSTTLAGIFAHEKNGMAEDLAAIQQDYEQSMTLLQSRSEENQNLSLKNQELQSKAKKIADLALNAQASNKQQLRMANTKIDSLHSELTASQSKNSALKKQNQDLSQQHNVVRDELQDLLTKHQKLVTLFTNQKTVVTELKKQRDKMQLLVKAANGKYVEANKKCSEAQTKLTAAEKKADDIETHLIALEQQHGINWRRRLGITATPEVDAQVLKVDARTPPQLVINAGSKDKIEKDELFFLYDDKDFIGTARVRSVTETYCVAVIVELKFGKAIAQGVRVTTTKPQTPKSEANKTVPQQ